MDGAVTKLIDVQLAFPFVLFAISVIAVAGPGGETVRSYRWEGDRAANRRASAVAALELLLEHAETA